MKNTYILNLNKYLWLKSFIKIDFRLNIILWTLFSAFSAGAQNSYLDLSYNNTGFNLPSFKEYPMLTPIDMLVQTDQKSVVACEGFTASGRDLVLLRFNTNGSLDETFGTGGFVAFDHQEMVERVTGLAIQSDNKLIATGNLYLGDNFPLPDKWFATRFNPNGTIDDSYGTNGLVLIGSSEFVPLKTLDCAVQSDNKVLLVGETNTTGYDRGTVVRLNIDGTPDISFGNGGTLFPYPEEVYNGLEGIGIQQDGKIVVCGDLLVQPSLLENDYLIIRFDQNGILDNSFGNNGIVTADAGSLYGTLQYLDFQSDGKIVFSGTYFSNDALMQYNTSVLRFNQDGSVDNTFGNGGLVIINFNSIAEDLPHGLAVKSDGKIAVAFAATQPPPAQFSLFMLKQLLVDGSPDPAFGTDGLVQLNLTGGNAIQTMALQADDKVLMAGLGADSQTSLTTLVIARALPTAVPEGFSPLIKEGYLSIYPNPTLEYATITFELFNSTTVSISLYNVKGQCIRTFTDKQIMQSGKHQITLPFSNEISPGSYFLKLSDSQNKQPNFQIIKL